MFGAVLVGSTPDRSRVLKGAVIDAGGITLLRVLENYPTNQQLAHNLGTSEADLLLLDLADPRIAVNLAQVAGTCRKPVAIVGVGDHKRLSSEEKEQLIPVCIPLPPEPEELHAAIDEVVHRLRCHVERNLIAFLPSKAGSGASTIALNTALTLASCGRRVLVIEADLRSGVLSCMLNTMVQHSIQQLLRGSDDMDLFRIQIAIKEIHGVHFLLSSRTSRGPAPAWADYYKLLELTRNRYDDIIVDLPELINSGTRELVQRSRVVYNVCTPELLSIELAGNRCQELSDWGVPTDRVKILINRWHELEIEPPEIARQLRRPIMKVFPNDYQTVRRAITFGGAVPHTSPLGRAFLEFAHELNGIHLPKLEPQESPFPGLLRRLLWSTPKNEAPPPKADPAKPPQRGNGKDTPSQRKSPQVTSPPAHGSREHPVRTTIHPKPR